MTFKQYLESEGAGALTDLSTRLGVSKGRLSQLKGEDWPPDLALRAETETNGTLNASELSTIIARARKDAA